MAIPLRRGKALGYQGKECSRKGVLEQKREDRVARLGMLCMAGWQPGRTSSLAVPRDHSLFCLEVLLKRHIKHILRNI